MRMFRSAFNQPIASIRSEPDDLRDCFNRRVHLNIVQAGTLAEMRWLGSCRGMAHKNEWAQKACQN